MPISTRQQLKDYCLRRLGHPVIEINVDDDQVEDRIQDAIDFWNEYHFDGVERMYIPEVMTASVLNLDSMLGTNFKVGEKVVGSTSNAKGTIYSIDADKLEIQKENKAFEDGEIITGENTGFSVTLASTDAYEQGSLARGYFEISDSITGIVRVFPLGAAGSSATGSTNIFNVIYQFRLNDMYNLLSSDITYFQQVKMHLQLLDDMFAGNRNIRFNRKTNKVYIDVNWFETFSVGDHVIFEVFAIVDPEVYGEVYNDMFLRRYATALIKRQWGTNLKKFTGMQLPGGVMMNGQVLFDEAEQELMKLEDEMQSRYELPVDFMVG